MQNKRILQISHQCKALILFLALVSLAHVSLHGDDGLNDRELHLTPEQERILFINALNQFAEAIENDGQRQVCEEKWLKSAYQGNAYAQIKMAQSPYSWDIKRYWYRCAAQKRRPEAIRWLNENAGNYDTITIKRPSGILLEVRVSENVRYNNLTSRFIDDPLYVAYRHQIGAKQGDASDLYGLALCYMNGTGKRQDRADSLLYEAADLGYVDAQTLLSTMSLKEILNTDCRDDMILWFNEYAKKDWTVAQYYLGLLYYNGIGVEKDYGHAVYWFYKAAKNGCAEAKLDLSYCYFNGVGVKTNFGRGEKWYSRADAKYINLRL